MAAYFWSRDPLLWGGLLALLALGACARSGPPAPVYSGDQDRPPPASQQAALPPETRPAPQPVPVPSPPSGPATGRSIVVKPGDTLYSIARDNGVPLRALIDSNRIRAPYAVSPGERLDLPVARYHIARRGDTLYGIARKYNVDMRALVRANDIEPPYGITVGRKIALPLGGGTTVAARDDAATDAAPAAESRPPVNTSSLPAAETADPPPPLSSGAPAESERAARTPAPSAVPFAEPPPREGSRFLWPLRGRILLAFGPRGGGLHNDGINIAAREGTEIRAAEAGVVVYAGNELQGFGNLVLLRHAGEWMTAYGHASALLVKRGEVVRRGQVIARVGHTGNVSRSQLHFEIRRDDRPVDPMRHLVRLARGGSPSASSATVFRDARRDPG